MDGWIGWMTLQIDEDPETTVRRPQNTLMVGGKTATSDRILGEMEARFRYRLKAWLYVCIRVRSAWMEPLCALIGLAAANGKMLRLEIACNNARSVVFLGCIRAPRCDLGARMSCILWPLG